MLRKIKAEFHIDDYTFWQIKPAYEVYLLNEVLKIYRQEKNKAIKEIAQKCCSEKSNIYFYYFSEACFFFLL